VVSGDHDQRVVGEAALADGGKDPGQMRVGLVQYVQ
jgi:hypothetical protein